MDNPLSEKVVIITGASSGIGAATARALSPLGCRLVLAARSLDRLSALERELHGDVLCVQTDVTRQEQASHAVDAALQRFGRVDVLFANAGIYVAGAAIEGDPEAWSRLVDVNITGVLRTVHAVLPHMQSRGTGDILITSSISGHVDIPWEPVYSASKHAIQTIVHTLRRQVAPLGIRVGSVAPGMVANELWGITDKEEIDRRVAEHASLRSEDVARAVVFMLSQPPHVTIRDLVMLPQRQDL
jgi:ribitol 2-dehydrogenase